MKSDVEVPVGFCPHCKEKQPLFMIKVEEVPITICFKCEKILNKEDNVRVEYYPLSELSKVTSWDIKNGD